MDLFTHAHETRMRSEAPLAACIRPRTLDEAAIEQRSSGRVQTKFADISRPRQAAVKNTALRRAIQDDRLFSSLQKKTILFVKDVRESLN